MLTVTDALAIATIIHAAQSTAKVARLNDETGNVVYGHARSIGTEHGAFIASGDDVRDAFLRVTTREGWEVFWPVRDLMPEAATGTFAEYDW